MKLPLFPLSSHLLPEGRLALRIFEPRYTRMVKEVCANNGGFVVCMLNTSGNKQSNSHIFPLGTYCNVIDFDILKDGLLGITVEGQYCVKIHNIATEPDGLRIGECEPCEIWSSSGNTYDLQSATNRLKEIYDKYPEVAKLYSELKFDEPEWVINRWIELLPVNAEQKQHFLHHGDTNRVVAYLNQLID
ncbi:LON peptidase substrate-binding domain-containing protein [Glaciecola sp. 1036]|uniref:LON peptidase substrate-binding domain-containing protein n=1 Tax=Alteromonadaceae TaxID=72275 RepID=UPI003CFF0E33